MRLDPRTQQVERVGGVRWTIKDGIVYDARALLAERRADGRGAEAGTAGLGPALTIEFLRLGHAL